MIMGTANQEWDGIDRRHQPGWEKYEYKVLTDIKEVKEEVKEIRGDVTKIQLELAKMGMEIKQVVSKSATTTSTGVSLAISVISGVIIWLITGTKG